MGRPFLVCLLAVLAADAASAEQTDRRALKSPELVVETGGRMGTCDALTFTPDGKHLLAVGDDKVVRIWPCGEKLDRAGYRVLRWPSWREQRGSIYALALSPDPEGRHIAIAGFGLRIGTVMVLDRATGKIVHALTDTKDNQAVIRSLAFSPSGKRVAFGTEYGGVWAWDVTKDHAELLSEHGLKENDNRIRLVHFRDENTLLSVAEKQGQVVQWDVRRTKAPGVKLFQLHKSLRFFRVILSRDGQWLGGGAQGPLIVVRSIDGKQEQQIKLGDGDFVRSLAFDPQCARLAAGIGNAKTRTGFYIEGNDALVIYDLMHSNPRELTRLPHTYRADALAFHPDGRRLAVAGGANHEVTLWDLKRPKQPVSEVRSAGSCLWSVALANDGRYLAFRDQRDPKSSDPNRRGQGPWRVFDLERRRWAQPAKLNLVEAPARGWTVRPDQKDPYLWHAVAPDGRAHPLVHDKLRYGMPRCYTFLPARGGKPVRVAVGHLYGLSIFELTANGARRVRLCVGHQGEVMALAASADQKWLVSASTDQTISAWGLEDWASQPELGARFLLRGGKLYVDRVDVGGPAWEAGLVEGDEVTLLALGRTKVDGGAGAWLERLRRPEPGKVLYFELRRGKQKVETATQARQRPLWRFFPARDREWVLWMWQNYYYDTSTNGDSLIGWHVNNRDLDREPRFYKAEQFRKPFLRRDVIGQLLATRKVAAALPKDNLVPPDFDGMEPPAVRMQLATRGDKGDVVKVLLAAEPRGDNPDHDPRQVDLWINDFRFRSWKAESWEAEGKAFRREVAIPRAVLRGGVNELTLQTYNRLGGRAEVSAVVNRSAPAEKPRLFGIFVGVNDYRQPGVYLVVGSTFVPDGTHFLTNLKSARKDAEAMHAGWQRQKGRMYAQANVWLRLDKNVSPAGLLKELKALAGRVRPDDRLVLFLSGHGDLHVQGNDRTFVFCGPDYDRKRPTTTGLTSDDLYEALADLRCRKIVILDACHSGDLAINPVRSLTPGGRGPTILAACDPTEPSYEHEKFGGLFTYAILEAFDQSFPRADRNNDGSLDAAEIFAYVEARVPELLKAIKMPVEQHPIGFPRELESYPLVQK